MRAYEPLVRRIFNQLDTVADGKLTFKELRQGPRGGGAAGPRPDRKVETILSTAASPRPRRLVYPFCTFTEHLSAQALSQQLQ